MRRWLLLAVGILLVLAACGDDSSGTKRPSGGVSDGQMEQLVAAAEDVRGLEFIEPPTITIVSLDELAERIRLQLEEELDPTDLLVQQRLFELLGLLDGTVDLQQAYLDLYAEAVGGYYDDDSGEMVISGDDALSPLSKTIVVHELIHALTDQHFGFAGMLDTLVEEERFHEASALQALAEGDALYYQLVYMQTLPIEEQVGAVQESLAADTSVQDSLPSWFAQDLTWPYDAGFRFVERIVTDQDVPGLDQAYTLTPTTTEQIMHPGAYSTLQPALPVELPAATVTGYEIHEEGEWGEWNLQLFLLDGVPPGEAIVGATGWGGDDYRIYWNGTDVVFAYLYEGDTTTDATELAASLTASVAATMDVGSPTTNDTETVFAGGGDYAAVAIAGKRILFVAAADPAAGAALFDQLRSVFGSG